MNCITWINRGIGFEALPSLVKELVNKYDVDIFAILEPRNIGDKVVIRIKRIGLHVPVRV